MAKDPGSRRQTLVSATAITAPIAGVVLSGAAPFGVSLEASAYLVAQAVFTYGSGGTTAKFWLQTSIDGGATWIDIMSFAFLLATATKVSSVTTAIALAPAVTPGSAALADNTILTGLIGDRLRVIGTTTGTYAGGTTIAIDVVTKG